MPGAKVDLVAIGLSRSEFVPDDRTLCQQMLIATRGARRGLERGGEGWGGVPTGSGAHGTTDKRHGTSCAHCEIVSD
jgi:hypothetical protein